jgi:PP-loop superfamily ATP-utilizing enzyme
MKAICAELKALGFQYVTIDLEGYRKGSMNMSQESFKSLKYFT